MPRAALSVYYGVPCPDSLRVLARHATVILQSGLYSDAQLRNLRGSSRVLGYLSVGEDHPLGAYACVPGSQPYHRDLNPAWGSVHVDAHHPAWLATVLRRASDALTRTDGLLLDTLDSADPEATVALIRAVRARWPLAVLYANRGFALLDDLIPLIDGVLFEAFSTTHSPTPDLHDPDGLAYTAHWLHAATNSGLDVLALDYADTPALAALARARAAAHGLPTFVTSRSLDLPGGFS
ncbi:hypothetical protein [Deinococcus sp. KSM4-11]|uniref:hypothetical protein n=1 Tax=Deinococcus sp. KSM4-11 TaxID=2568654 RepID=UPI001F10718B|nr:hypothetical protein [Deinococcus sp. KSM4-11]